MTRRPLPTPSATARTQHFLGKVKEPGPALVQADRMALAAVDAIFFMNLYSNRDEAPLYEMRKSVTAWLELECPDDILRDGRKWEVFIRPHRNKLVD